MRWGASKTVIEDEINSNLKNIIKAKKALIKELPWFDANIWLGQPAFFPLAKELTADSLGRILDKYSMRGALVSHWDSVRFSAQEGNEALLKIDGSLPENVYTVWTGLPTTPEEQPPLPGTGKPHPRVRGIRVFPKTHQYQLAPWVVGVLCEWCISYRLPLFIWHVEIEWDDVYNLAKTFPGLNIVIETQWQKIIYHLRDLFNLMKACRNIFVESSNLIGQDNVSYFVKSLAADRILFGSFLPVNDPYAGMGMILDADISRSDMEKVAGLNLKSLILGAHL